MMLQLAWYIFLPPDKRVAILLPGNKKIELTESKLLSHYSFEILKLKLGILSLRTFLVLYYVNFSYFILHVHGK